MIKGPLLLATFGLALNLFLWGVPGLVAASAVPHLLFPNQAPTLSEMLASAERSAGVTPSLPDALVQLIGAEAEAMHVAGVALQQPTPTDLVPQTRTASARVLEAMQTYERAAQTLLKR